MENIIFFITFANIHIYVFMKDFEYLVTIGMPVYGVEKYIRKCLESALNQTFQSIEFIMVDDRGPDKSVNIIRELQQTHPRGKDIRIITQPENMGCWAARNTVLEKAQGKYIFLMDSDDYISPDCIEVLYEAAEKHNAEATLGSIQYIYDEGPGKQIRYDFRIFDKADEFANYANQSFKVTVSDFIWNILIRKDLIDKNHLRFPKTKFWDDVLFNSRFQPCVTRAVLMPNITYYYVIRDNSLSSYESRKIIKIEEIRQHLNNCNYLNEQCRELKGKPYYEMRCAKEMLHAFYTIIGALRNRDKIRPAITDKELMMSMKHPTSLSEIVRFKRHRNENLAFYILGVLPSSISIFAIKMMAKRKHLL